MFVVSSIGVLALIYVAGSDPVVEDTPVAEALGEVAQFADEKLQALALGDDVPDPPLLRADAVSLRLALTATAAFQLVTVIAVVIASGKRPAELIRVFKLDRPDFSNVWRPALFAFGAYVFVGVYAAIASALDIDALVPESTVPRAVTRDTAALALAGVVAVLGAPIAEELLYRGLIFGGLLKWGFWPAAMVSGSLFSAVHLDTGSFIPFLVVGVFLAWAFWRRGRLWDSILFHFFFNLGSYLILVASAEG